MNYNHPDDANHLIDQALASSSTPATQRMRFARTLAARFAIAHWESGASLSFVADDFLADALRASEEDEEGYAAFEAEMKAFEDAMLNGPFLPIFEFIGSPQLVAPDELSVEQASLEAERLLELLGHHGICIDFPDEVDDLEIYRFLVEDLMQEEIAATRFEGWRTHFIYEEFFDEYWENSSEDDWLDDDPADNYRDDEIPF